MTNSRALVFRAALTAGCLATPGALAQDSTNLDDASYLLSNERLLELPDVGWDGFLTGLEGFDHFHDPISNPLYHESALINTQLKFLYIHHTFPDDNALAGGDLDIAALQIRVALTERLAFIAVKDGYTWFNPGLLPNETEGWNDFSAGLKYAFYVSEEHDMVATTGFRYLWRSGAQRILQGSADELSPFISVAKGFGDLHLHGNLTYRIGIEEDDSNDVFQWSFHADYEVAKGIAPVVEINGLHYVDDGTRTPLSVGGLDYSNFGSTNVEGNTVVWAGVGASFKLTPNITLGATYEFPLTDEDDDIMNDRVTAALTFTF